MPHEDAQLEADAQMLRAMLSPIAPRPPRARGWWLAALVVAAGAILVAPLIGWRHPLALSPAVVALPPSLPSLPSLPSAAVAPRTLPVSPPPLVAPPALSRRAKPPRAPVKRARAPV